VGFTASAQTNNNMHSETTPSTTTVHWLSDLHLDRASDGKIESLHETIAGLRSNALIITGDISSAKWIAKHLRGLAGACAPRPLYFVLGNHDFHDGSIESVEREVAAVCRSVPNLRHLDGGEVFPLSRNTGLIGHRGWADARAGWGGKTVIDSRDHGSIGDFRNLSKAQRYVKMEALGKEAAAAFRRTLPFALSRYRHVVIATHVPPFPESAHFGNKPCGPTHLPHFANLSAGMALVGITRNFPRRRVTVLAGHTHSPVRLLILDNLEARVGGARTGNPGIQGGLDFP
jgi:Icc protein